MPAIQDSRADEVTITEKLNDFIQKNRRKLIIGLISVMVLLVVFIIATTVYEKVQVNALLKVDEFNERYIALQEYVTGDSPEAVIKQVEIILLQQELSAFAAKSSGFAAARAYVLSAGIYWEQKDWSQAEEAWIASAKAAPKTYLAPLSLYNAAVAAEEQGNIQSAIDLYNRALAHEGDFASAARAQFSIGRLEESQNNRAAAIEAYRNLVNKWPNDPVWSNLAQSRIIVLAE